MSRRHLVLVRHGESEWNAVNRLQGQADPKLSEAGLEQARGLATALSALEPMPAIVSDLSRARHTAELAGRPDATVDPRWRERRLGAWEGVLEEDVDPAELEVFRRTDQPPEGGETWPRFQARVGGAMDELAQRGGSWLIFTHGGCIRAAVSHLTGADHMTVAGPRNGSLTVLEIAERSRLLAYNWSAFPGAALRILPATDPGGADVEVRTRTEARDGGPGGASSGHAES